MYRTGRMSEQREGWGEKTSWVVGEGFDQGGGRGDKLQVLSWFIILLSVSD